MACSRPGLCYTTTIGLFTICMLNVSALIRFNNLQCKSYNEKLAVIAYCRIKTIDRYIQETSLRVNVYDKPMTNISFSVQLKRKSNSVAPYNPFMSVIKMDACEYLIKRNNIIVSALYNMFVKYSNVNHTCPYDHDLILERLRMDDSVLNWIPFPAGDYAFFVTLFVKGLPWVQIDFYFSYLEK